MDDVTRRVTLGRALLKAKNYSGAQREAALALEADPHSNDAFNLLFDILSAQQKWQEAAALVEDWLTACPDSFDAHAGKILRLLDTEDGRKNVHAFIEHVRSKFPLMGLTLDRLELIVDAVSGRPTNQKLVGRLSEPGALSGIVQHFEAEHEYRKGCFKKASQKFAESLKYDPTNKKTLLFSTASLWHSGKFSQARRMARRLIDVSPEETPRAKELIISSWVVYFPAFFFTNSIMTLFACIRSNKFRFQRYIGYFALFIVWNVMMESVSMIAAFAPDHYLEPAWYASMIVWFIYRAYGWQKWAEWQLRRQNSIALSPDY